MKDHQNIDQFFRENLKPKTGQYDPSYWKEAERMLKGYNRKRGFWYRFRYAISGIALFLISSVAYVGYEASTEDSPVKVSSIKRTEQTQNPAMDLKNINQMEIDVPQTASIPTPENKNEKQISPVIQNSTTPVQDDQLEEIGQEEKSTPENTDIQNSAIAGTEIQNQTEERQDFKDTQNPNNNNSTPIAASSISTGAASLSNSSEEKELSQDEKRDIEESKALLAGVLSATSDSEVEEFEVESTTNSQAEDIEMPTVVDEDSSMTEEEEIVDLNTIRVQEPKTTGFRVYGGPGITQKVITEQGTTKNNLSGFIGIGYERLLMNNFSAEIRLQVSARNAFAYEHKETQIDYDFGYVINEKNIQYQNIIYLETPLMVNYFIRPKHVVGLGIQYSRLLTLRYNLEEYSSASLQDPVINTETKFGISEQYNRNEFSLLMGYRYQITRRWNAGILGQMALIPTMDFNDVERWNHQLRLQISYKLFE